MILLAIQLTLFPFAAFAHEAGQGAFIVSLFLIICLITGIACFYDQFFKINHKGIVIKEKWFLNSCQLLLSIIMFLTLIGSTFVLESSLGGVGDFTKLFIIIIYFSTIYILVRRIPLMIACLLDDIIYKSKFPSLWRFLVILILLLPALELWKIYNDEQINDEINQDAYNIVEKMCPLLYDREVVHYGYTKNNREVVLKKKMLRFENLSFQKNIELSRVGNSYNERKVNTYNISKNELKINIERKNGKISKRFCMDIHQKAEKHSHCKNKLPFEEINYNIGLLKEHCDTEINNSPNSFSICLTCNTQ